MDEGLFILLVEQHPNVYDKKRKDFKDATMRQNSWEEISSAMGESVEECQRLWRNLRDRYVRKRKAAKDTPSGAAAAIEPKWSLYKSLMFLEAHILPRRTTSNVKKVASRPSSAATSVSISSAHPGSPFDTIGTILSPEDIQPIQDADEDVVMITPSKDCTPCTAVPPTERRGKRNLEKLDDRIASAMENVAQHLQKIKRPSSNESFTKYVERRLMDLPPDKQKLAKRQILSNLDDIDHSFVE